MVSSAPQSGVCTIFHSAASVSDTNSPRRQQTEESVEKDDPGCFSGLRECLKSAGIPENTANIILSSWRGNTQKQYGTYLKKWIKFCDRSKIDKFQPSIADLLKFLTELHDSGLGYSAVNTAKSAISSFLSIADPNHCQFGSHVLIKRFIKGIFEIKPSLPRYNCTWDTEIVLKFLKSLSPLSELSLLQLSRKLVTLFALTTGQRAQTLHMFDIRNIESCETHLKIRIGDLLKQSSPKNHLSELFISQYEIDSDLCVVKTYLHYVQRTVDIRQDPRLFIKSQKPYSWVSRATLSHWIKDTLALSGIDMACFSTHSTRAASCSKAVTSNVPIDTVLRTAGWKRDNVFRKFYHRPVSNDDRFSQSILKQV